MTTTMHSDGSTANAISNTSTPSGSAAPSATAAVEMGYRPHGTTNTEIFPASADVDAIMRLALAEDVGRGDITTEATVPLDAVATAHILQKAPGVLCGLPVVEAVFARLDPRVTVTRLAAEGSFDDQRRVV